MQPHSRRSLLLTLVALGITFLVGMFGMSIGRSFTRNQLCCNVSPFANLKSSLLEYFRAEKYYSQSQQDRFVLHAIYPKRTHGYFVDVGSADGVLHSNSKALEERGWSGICIDPFPTNMVGRTCQLFTEVVDMEPGRLVEFRVAGEVGGIDQYLGPWRSNVQHAPTVRLKTTTLDDVLGRARAPRVIDFMSIDIEGAELAALKGFSFEKYKVGAITIEHNFEEPKRSEIRHFLEGKGYLFLASLWQDDVYVLPHIKPDLLKP